MEVVEEVVVPPLPTMDQNKDLSSGIAKGKRTKRHRPLSPIPFTIDNITPPPFILEDNINNNHHHSSPSTPVSATSSVESTTTEEEDMARCLILLARGHFSANKEDPRENINTKSTTTNGNNKDAGGSGGACVYACKTCNRAFSSFQALGGHRASHKKPKNEKKSSSPSLFMSDEEDLPSPSISTSSKNRRMSLSLQLNNISTTTTTATAVKSTPSPRMHECSYCGAEFTSGQALGGHMRRHRAGPASPLSKPPVISVVESKEIETVHQRIRPKNGLSLDLNLPAPPEDDRHHKFTFDSKQIFFV